MGVKYDMTFMEHLEQLRWVLIRAIGIISILMFVSFFYSNNIQSFIMSPINQLDLDNFKLQDIKITSPFMVKIVIALFTSLILGFPYFVFEVYRFIYPAIAYDGYLSNCSQSAAVHFRDMSLGNLQTTDFWDAFYDYDSKNLFSFMKNQQIVLILKTISKIMRLKRH